MNVHVIARRAAVAVLAVSALALVACGNKGSASGGSVGSAAAIGADMTIGDPNAPVKVIEYASPTCPHCRKYEDNDFPAFKAKYVDTGKVLYVFRETPIHPTFDGPAFLLARCVASDKYFDVIKGVMDGQDEYASPAIFNGPNPGDAEAAAFRTVLIRLAKDKGGLDETKAIACMSDEDALKKLSDRAQSEGKEFDVNETPTFVIDGVKLKQPEGVEMSNELVFPAVDQALAKKKH